MDEHQSRGVIRFNTDSMGPVRMRHRSRSFATQSSHFVNTVECQPQMASIEFGIPWLIDWFNGFPNRD